MLAGAAGAVVLGGPFLRALEVVETRSGAVRLCARMAEGEEFTLAFTHSVNRRPVCDTLRIARERIVIVRSRFDAFGAGMPETTTAEGTLSVAEDGWLVWTVNRSVPEIVVRVGRVAGHTLNLRGRDIALADLAPPGSALTLRARRLRPLDLLTKGRCNP
jgi:hypothetical protein